MIKNDNKRHRSKPREDDEGSSLSGCAVSMMVEGGNVDEIHHGTSRDMLRGPSKVDMDGSDLQYTQEGM